MRLVWIYTSIQAFLTSDDRLNSYCSGSEKVSLMRSCHSKRFLCWIPTTIQIGICTPSWEPKSKVHWFWLCSFAWNRSLYVAYFSICFAQSMFRWYRLLLNIGAIMCNVPITSPSFNLSILNCSTSKQHYHCNFFIIILSYTNVAFCWCSANPKMSRVIILTWNFPVIVLVILSSSHLPVLSRSKTLTEPILTLLLVYFVWTLKKKHVHDRYLLNA